MSACCSTYPQCEHGRAEQAARVETRAPLAPIATLPRSTSPGRLLRFEQPIAPDPSDPAAADVLRHQQIADTEARLRAHREAASEVAS